MTLHPSLAILSRVLFTKGLPQMLRNRKIYIVDPRLQYSIMYQVILITVFISLIFIMTLGIISAHYLGYINGNPDMMSSLGQLAEYAGENYAVFLILVVIATLYITGALAILITHQVAGPVYRFLKILDKLVEGDFTEDFNLRKDDHLTDVADRIKGLMLFVRNAIGEERRCLAELRAALETDGPLAPEVSEKLQAAEAAANRFILPEVGHGKTGPAADPADGNSGESTEQPVPDEEA